MVFKLNMYFEAKDGNIKYLINRFNLTSRLTAVTGTC